MIHFPFRETRLTLMNMSGCYHKDRCGKVHFDLPYRWEFKDRQGWSGLTDNEAIEQDYCDPAKTYRFGTGFSSLHMIMKCNISLPMLINSLSMFSHTLFSFTM